MQQSYDAFGLPRHTSTFKLLLEVLKKEGIKGLYRGNVGTILRDIPGNIVWFGAYEWVARLFLKEGQTKNDLTMFQVFVAGAAAYYILFILYLVDFHMQQFHILLIQ